MGSTWRHFKALIVVAALCGATFVYNHLRDGFGEPALTPGAIRPANAVSHVGESVEVQGIARVHEKQSATFIDLGGDYPTQDLAVVIWPDDREQFGDLAALDGKPIAVRGTVTRYNGDVEIVVRVKEQLRAL